MNLKGIVSVSGKQGLYKLLGQNKSGLVLESLDTQKLKLVVNLAQTKMASLEDITIYGDSEDIGLTEILTKMRSEADVPDPKKTPSDQLRAFFRKIVPEHDEERVYVSDIKKIVSWYHILKDQLLFDENPQKSEDEE